MALFENYDRRIDKINGVLKQYGIESVEACREMCQAKGFDPYEIVKGIQPICFENACWAYTVGAAIAMKKGVKTAAEAATAIGEGLQAFCIDGSVADDRKVGLGHGNLGAMLLSEESECFCFLAGHESFAAAEGAIGIVKNANKARKKPLRVILNGLGKDAAQIISRINGFTYVQTQFDYYTGELYRTMMERWVEDNVALIKTIPQESLGRMRQIVLEGYRNGETTTAIVKQIQRTYSVDRRHAQLLARDQIAKLNGDITQQQQQDAGVVEYVWSTSGDSRVRPSHAALNHKRFRWDDPPVVDEKTGRRCHPGKDYQCRCCALPVFNIKTVDLPVTKGGDGRG